MRTTSYILYDMTLPADAISAAQCRAARALLEWSQEQLAENARVARPTIADFERNTRFPMRNNLLSIISAFEAAGVGFIGEGDEGGAGVRFRRVELEYSKSLKQRGGDLVIPGKYRGERVDIIVPADLLDDIDRTPHGSKETRLRSAQEHLHQLLVAAEKRLQLGVAHGGQIILGVADFPDGTF
jgi:transcriptional regulator with XRE-family HTH domain